MLLIPILCLEETIGNVCAGHKQIKPKGMLCCYIMSFYLLFLTVDVLCMLN